MTTREEMVALIRERGVRDAAVLNAMLQVPRDRFVLPAYRHSAYGDFPLPLGHGQTISQPYIVALMTAALELARGDRVLEVGTGSGYQAAILAEMGMKVYTIERVEALFEIAKFNLKTLGYKRVTIRLGDGREGWPKHAPYQGIIATAAPTKIPQALIDQLDEGGRLVIPIGPQGGYQTLWKVIKIGDDIREIDLGGVAFVPLV
ncbi:MAG: protein-L-isoaspartate(D-aspartate) O-methyltransferase [Anaerolineae bacterium]|nr:protein-L-isoaspartate(D-aspartate) O-methyltransferase [Anaerolineae bacterium]